MDRLAAEFFLPVDVLQAVFQGKFVDGLKTLHAEHKIQFHGTLAALQNRKAFAAWLRPLFRSQWVVYAKRPSGGAQHALRYLGQYTHRVAISSHRLVALADAPILAARASAGIRPHPPLWVDVSSLSRRGAALPLCLQLLAESGRVAAEAGSEEKAASSPSPSPLWTCPQCGSPMGLIERLSPRELRLRAPPTLAAQPA